MQITTTGKGIELTEAIKDYVEKKLGALEKFFDRIERIEVTVGMESHHHAKGDIFFAEAKLLVPGNDLFVKEVNQTLYTAIDAIRDRLENDLKKHKITLAGNVKKQKAEGRAVKEYVPEE
jgi:putative sigma-54 modulation protein